MANDISGFGVRINMIASKTFPAGLTLTQFADDADSLDIPAIEITNTAKGLNGDLVSWKTAKVIPVNLNLIPTSDDDKNMAILAQSNLVSKGKKSVRDVIQMVVVYPDGSTVSFINGVIKSAPFGQSIASAGRMKSKQYMFEFEDIIATN